MTPREDVAVTLLMLLALFIAVVCVARLAWLGICALVAAISRAADRRIVAALGCSLTGPDDFDTDIDQALEIVRDDWQAWKKEVSR